MKKNLKKLNLSNISQKDRFQVQTYIKIKKVNYDIKLLELEDKNTLLLKQINNKSLLKFKVTNIFESKENTEKIYNYFKTNEIENFMKNKKRTLNFFFLGPNKSKKLSNLTGYVDFNNKKNTINDGILQKTIKFLIKKYPDYEIGVEILKNENNKIEKFTKNLKTKITYRRNNFYIIKNEKTLKTLNDYIIKIKSRFFNNFNILIILHLQKKKKKDNEKTKLITFTRLSLDESLNSNNKMQQILSYSDYLALKKYILFLKEKDLSQTSLNNVFSSSKIIKELNNLIFGAFNNYNEEFEDIKNLQSFLMIQYINPNESCYESCLNSLVYLSYFSKRYTASKIKSKKLHSLKFNITDKEILEYENDFKLKLRDLEKFKESFKKFTESLNIILCENFTQKFLINNKNEVINKMKIFGMKENKILMEKEKNMIINEFEEDEEYIEKRMKNYEKEDNILNKEIKDLNDKEYNLEKNLNDLKLEFKNKTVNYDNKVNQQKEKKNNNNEFDNYEEYKIFDTNNLEEKSKNISDLKKKYLEKMKNVKNNYREYFNSLLTENDLSVNNLNKKYEHQKISIETSINRFEKDFKIYKENKIKKKEKFDQDLILFTEGLKDCPKFLAKFNKDLFLLKNKKKNQNKEISDLQKLSVQDLKQIEKDLNKKLYE